VKTNYGQVVTVTLALLNLVTSEGGGETFQEGPKIFVIDGDGKQDCTYYSILQKTEKFFISS